MSYEKALSLISGGGGGGLLPATGDNGTILEVNATPEEATNAVAVEYVSSETGGHERAFITAVFYSEGKHGMMTSYFSASRTITTMLVYDGTKYVKYNGEKPQG